MDIVEAIKKRKSVRSFKSDRIPQTIIREILEIACRAPSAMNTQPWEFVVVEKDVLEAIGRAAVEKFRAGEEPRPEHSVVGWPKDSVYRRRQVELAKRLFGLLDIKREDVEKRRRWMESGLAFFNAPAAVVVCVDEALAEGTPVFDLGAVTQNICLAALHYGLGTCIQDQGVAYPEVLREHCRIPESKRIVIAVAMGYPDWDSPANKLETPREPVDAVTAWCGFH